MSQRVETKQWTIASDFRNDRLQKAGWINTSYCGYITPDIKQIEQGFAEVSVELNRGNWEVKGITPLTGVYYKGTKSGEGQIPLTVGIIIIAQRVIKD